MKLTTGNSLIYATAAHGLLPLPSPSPPAGPGWGPPPERSVGQTQGLPGLLAGVSMVLSAKSGPRPQPLTPLRLALLACLMVTALPPLRAPLRSEPCPGDQILLPGCPQPAQTGTHASLPCARPRPLSAWEQGVEGTVRGPLSLPQYPLSKSGGVRKIFWALGLGTAP